MNTASTNTINVNTVSFISANFVARELGYNMTEGWMQGDAATQAFYAPLETFGERFDAMLAEVAAMGFTAIDLWGAHLNPAWVSDAHLQIARGLLDAHGLKVTALAAWSGSLEQLEGFCRVAVAVGSPVIGGGAPLLKEFRSEAVTMLKKYNIKLALENHPEKTSAEMFAQIADGGDGMIGTACDTGWWGTQGYDAAQAIRELKGHLMAVHLKDIQAAGAHDTCKFGLGVVDIQACVQAMREIGYTGPIGIEHEPEHHDPTQDILQSKAMLETWMKGGNT
jgi:L-ribulose-5-phosphate 3-epimerase